MWCGCCFNPLHMDVKYRHIKLQKLFHFFFLNLNCHCHIWIQHETSPTCASDLSRRDNEYHWESLTIKVLFELISPLQIISKKKICWWQCFGGGGYLQMLYLPIFDAVEFCTILQFAGSFKSLYASGGCWSYLTNSLTSLWGHYASQQIMFVCCNYYTKLTEKYTVNPHVKIEIPSYSYSAGLKK